jgi:hypothetical protein
MFALFTRLNKKNRQNFFDIEKVFFFLNKICRHAELGINLKDTMWHNVVSIQGLLYGDNPDLTLL